MTRPKVAIVRYEAPVESVRRAVDLAGGLDHLPRGSKVFIKPNIVFWSASVPFPKWGVITTSRVVEDAVILLKEHGIHDITIGEGTVVFDPKDFDTPAHAFKTLGYEALEKRYGVKTKNLFAGSFEKVDLGDGVELNFSKEILHCDFVVNLPVLKTHAQTVVSLGIKNIKGTIDIRSRKKCHSADPQKDLHFWVSRLADKLPPSLTVLDGIFTIERGPGFDGKARRSDIIVASSDMLSADMVGATLLGYQPSEVPYIVHAAERKGRPLDLSHLEVLGESIEALSSLHQYTFPYNAAETLPLPMERMGIKGLSYPKYDLSLCTYCSLLTGAVLTSIAMAWKGQPWDNVEVLTGKIMKPTPGKKTLLIGKCLYEANRNHPRIDEMVTVKSCPPSPKAIIDSLHQVGVDIRPDILLNLDKAPAFFMGKYEGKPEFDESFFRVESQLQGE